MKYELVLRAIVNIYYVGNNLNMFIIVVVRRHKHNIANSEVSIHLSDNQLIDCEKILLIDLQMRYAFLSLGKYK